jgi:D-alanine-D-alanine ligase
MQHKQQYGRRLVVLHGGDSPEREVSLASGQNVADALRAGGYDVCLVDPAETPLESVDWHGVLACAIALHGGAGEDGGVQRQLEKLQVPYTGSDSHASWLAMSKMASKCCFLRDGLPTLSATKFRTDDSSVAITRQAALLDFPVVIKPDGGGSSIGVAVATRASEVTQLVRDCGAVGSTALAEPFVRGRELTITLLGRRPLPVIEIVCPERIFDYASKYHRLTTEYRFRTGLSTKTLRQLDEIAVATTESLGTRGLVRVDLLLDEDQRPWILEVNTVPGMTPRSLAPMAAAHAGIDRSALCHWMVEDCVGQLARAA